jgi:hypothetical protein
MMQTHYMAQTDYSWHGISPAWRRRGARRDRFIARILPYFPIKIKYLSLTIKFKTGPRVNNLRADGAQQFMAAIEDFQPRGTRRATPTAAQRRFRERFAGPFIRISRQ